QRTGSRQPFRVALHCRPPRRRPSQAHLRTAPRAAPRNGHRRLTANPSPAPVAERLRPRGQFSFKGHNFTAHRRKPEANTDAPVGQKVGIPIRKSTANGQNSYSNSPTARPTVKTPYSNSKIDQHAVDFHIRNPQLTRRGVEK